ncbi:hypothetical protein CVU83_00805 [Candidatus Falkowbacteria bacterium HGW-Falkowbacteria-2]|uniref:HTH arsR-type domain-containing protein n=1 Tax=Candidatus Falkowbacteria bacterium HGW-Falkowbacteria-2 TaxID=2013769 RepID=A0A2N2E2M3_9BACT|nr:MAG: hypothetical protein CVU83_00805 [Candidatus Falkowbacteria bacterium HGW-Falkowbacteria-2]
MLAQIFGSNARVKILKTFLSKPEQKYYTRQLARDLDLQVNSVRRELENLQAIGLLKLEEAPAAKETSTKTSASKDLETKSNKNEKKYLVVNRDFLLFNELKSLFAKANLLSCQDFIKEVSAAGDVKRMWLSGLFTGDLSSPTDLLAVGKIKKDAFLKRLHTLEADLNKEINYTMMDEDEYDYRTQINDIFLHKIRQSRHLKVIEPTEEEEAHHNL